MELAAELRGVSLYYGGQQALAGIDLEVEPGEFLYLTGPSGAGKTSLLRILSHEVEASTGEVWVDGTAVHALPRRRLAALRRRIGVVFRDFKLLPQLSALENVAFALEVSDLSVPPSEVRERSAAVLAEVGLEGLEDRLPSQLSGGQQQRVGIARALVTQPRLILADEPTGNLDAASSRRVLAELEKASQAGASVVMATHDTTLLSRFRHRAVSLLAGRIAGDRRVAPVLVAGTWAR